MIFEIIKRAGFADGTESPDSTHDLGFESDDQENIYDDGKHQKHLVLDDLLSRKRQGYNPIFLTGK